jgi:transcriptional regulator with XRE-family HTH domain
MSIANFGESLQREEAGLRCSRVTERPPARPIFHRELGELLVTLRTARAWSVQQAVIQSRVKHPGVLTWNVLTRLESGKTKHPDAEALRALADLYELDYTVLATSFVVANYGRDLLRHVGTGQQTPHQQGESRVPAPARIIELETQLARERAEHAALISQITTVSRQLVQLLTRAEIGKTTSAQSNARRRHRNTG